MEVYTGQIGKPVNWARSQLETKGGQVLARVFKTAETSTSAYRVKVLIDSHP